MAKRNPLIRPRPKPIKLTGNKSAGILDDFAVRKVINSKEGTIEKTPINSNDITNKAYVDNAISGFPSTNQISPIGSVTAWLKSYTNTPALSSGWVECNGQTLSDADSVYDGQVIPNLNGTSNSTKIWLRGATTSGSTGGSATHNHSFTGIAHSHSFTGIAGSTSVQVTQGSNNVSAGTNIKGTHTHTFTPTGTNSSTAATGTISTKNNLPPYYDVVWIMRIK